MTDSPAKVVQKLLVQLGLGSAVGGTWPVVAGTEPNAPDDVMTVKDTAGTDDGRTMFGDLMQHYGIQVRFRSADRDVGYAKANTVRSALALDVYNDSVTLPSGVSYQVHCAAGIGQVLTLGLEAGASKRNLFTLNFKTAITEL